MKKLLTIALLICGCEEALESIIEGCTTTTACNYDADATKDDDSCIFEVDCEGVCGGDKVENECGECGHNGSTCLINNECTIFLYNTSIVQAFYYFHNVTINDENINAEDWVGAFNGNVCVGSRKWDTSSCGGVCDVPVLGYDGSDLTEGYMQSGDIPTFKIYDVSENLYYEAIPSENFSWSYSDMNIISTLEAVISSESHCY